MNGLRHRCMAASLRQLLDSTVFRFNGFKFFLAFVLVAPLSPWSTHGQPFALDKTSARSISGQFIIYGAPKFSTLAVSPKVAADTNFVRLEPALLAVSAERIKDSLYRRLEVKPGTPWSGQIYLVVHPARSLDESVNIISKRLAGGWDYRVELPDVLARNRLTRAITGVLLLELANRGAQAHSAEIPAWLADGFAQQLLAAGLPDFILSAPNKVVNGLPVARINATQHGLYPLGAAAAVLKNHPALTFEELSWPTGAQLDGDDGGVYRASAQVFVDSLLDLKNGPAQMQSFLQSLPQFYNWQIAFRSVYGAEFPRPLDLEKWWALQVVGFVAGNPGPGWTPAVSREKLDQILSVPVQMRTASNSLPVPAEISLQAVIRNLDAAQQTAILTTKLRDLEIAQLRVAPEFAALTDGYRRALDGYLGEHRPAVSAPGRHSNAISKKTSASDTLKKLDLLDARRRAIEANVKPEKSVQPSLAPLKF
jgi:hypothetical protein